MFKFQLHTAVSQASDFKSFALDEVLKEDDLIVTNQFIYDPFIRDLLLPCKVLFQEKYGSGEPNDGMIDDIRRDIPPDIKRIIAVGGGTVIDISKVLIFEGAWKTEDIFLGKVIPEKVRDLIVLPTTCGTGSEVTNITICELKKRFTKKGLALNSMYADRAVLIPDMLKTLPYKFFATSAIDAFIHAMESYLSPKAIPHSTAYSEQAMQMILKGFSYVAENGGASWLDKREDFLVASNLAGIAFGHAGCAAVHATSYPLGGKHHIPHGEVNQLMVGAVLYKYKEKNPKGRLEKFEGLIAKELNVNKEAAISSLLALFDQIYKKKALKEYGITYDELVEFTDSVLEGQQRLLNNNYVVLTRADILSIYEAGY